MILKHLTSNNPRPLNYSPMKLDFDSRPSWENYDYVEIEVSLVSTIQELFNSIGLLMKSSTTFNSFFGIVHSIPFRINSGIASSLFGHPRSGSCTQNSRNLPLAMFQWWHLGNFGKMGRLELDINSTFLERGQVYLNNLGFLEFRWSFTFYGILCSWGRSFWRIFFQTRKAKSCNSMFSSPNTLVSVSTSYKYGYNSTYMGVNPKIEVPPNHPFY